MASSLASRFIVAAFAVPAILAAIYLGDHTIFWLIIAVAGAIGMDELFAMSGQDKTDRMVSMICGLAAMSCLYWLGPGGTYMKDAHGMGGLLTMFIAVVPVIL